MRVVVVDAVFVEMATEVAMAMNKAALFFLSFNYCAASIIFIASSTSRGLFDLCLLRVSFRLGRPEPNHLGELFWTLVR